MSHGDAADTTCANCGSPQHGSFCHSCGQKAVTADVRLHDLFHEAFHEFAHFDGKIVQTLRLLLTQPGRLTTEFLNGHRARYLSPLRLYLTCSVLFFGAVALAPDISHNLITVSYRPSPGDAPVDAATIRQWEEAASARAGSAIVHDMPRVMFALMPVFGLLTWALYRKARPFYAAHLYYSIHFHAFAFLILTLAVPLILVGNRPLARALPLAMIAYLYPSLRRVFGGSRGQVAWKGTLIWFAYLLVVVTTLVALGWRSGALSDRPGTGRQAADAHGVPASGSGLQAADRERALAMFARAYYPGRSGQIMIVPREGSVIVSHAEPEVRFMHGSPWRYDTAIPLILYGAPYVKPGTYHTARSQQDVMPTIARVLDLPVPATVTGKPLVEALATPTTAPQPPRIVVLAVMDGMRLDYFDKHAAVMPTLTRIRQAGAWFDNATVDFLPSITGPAHTTIASGTDPRFHGTTGNSMFDRVAGKPQDAYAGNSPRDLMVLNLADAWNAQTRGRAVIVAQGSSVPSAVGLAGHGACLFDARPIRMVSYSKQSGAWTSNGACYIFPEYLKQMNSREIWEAAGGKWMGHDVANADFIRRTSLFSRFETDAILSMIEHEAVGADDVPDLVLVNLKTLDFVAHQYGPDSPELRETIAELDRQFARLIDAVERKAPGRVLLALTADHGMPGEPSGSAQRVYTEDIVKLIHDRLDPEGKVVLHYEPENSQIYVDVDRLASLKHSLADVTRLLEQQPYVFAAFTEDEVRRGEQ